MIQDNRSKEKQWKLICIHLISVYGWYGLHRSCLRLFELKIKQILATNLKYCYIQECIQITCFYKSLNWYLKSSHLLKGSRKEEHGTPWGGTTLTRNHKRGTNQ